MNPRYLQEFLGYRIGSPIEERSREERLKAPCDLVK